jgi:aerobic-type carbon monoxide dehydrogenase small subunit (CoxS/CutS family)
VSRRISVRINGVPYERTVDSRTLLSDFLRHDVGLHGTHVGCEHGVCGACTVQWNGQPVRSCLMLAVQADGEALTTVEGLSQNGELSIVQQAFHETHALQCGFCTPGLLVTIDAFLAEHPDPAESDVREALAGNLCRCTGYQAIVAAVMMAAKRMRASVGAASRLGLD